MLDGAWGVLIHRRELSEEEYRGERFARTLPRRQGRPGPPQPDARRRSSPRSTTRTSRPARTSRRRTPSRRPRSGRPTTRSRDAAAEMSLAGRAPRARRRRRVDGANTRQAALRRRLGRPAERLALGLAEGRGRRRTARSTFDQVRDAYAEQIARAARRRRRPPADRDDLRHAEREGGDRRRARGVAPELPLWLSFTAIDRSGRNLSGQTSEAFWISVEHAEPLIVGVNCSLGATEMRPFLEGLARVASTYVVVSSRTRACRTRSGSTTSRPADTSRFLRAFAEDGLVNLVGGCCGTTPEHTRRRSPRGRGPSAAAGPRALAPAALLGPRAVRDRARHRLRHRRRADERDRLGEVPAADRGERLPERGRRRARAGARRREPARREHGRRPARRASRR